MKAVILYILMLSSSMVNKMQNNMEFWLNTDYAQFYLVDGNEAEIANSLWLDEEDFNSRIEVSGGVMGIRTERSGKIKVIVEVFDKKPDFESPNEYDHIVECSIEIKSGHLMIKNCPDFELVKDIRLPVGLYRIRVSSANFSTVDSDYSGEDFYRLSIWKESETSIKTVVKQYTD
jgi:hypothetical protein